MAGASNNERRVAFTAETTPGTTPTGTSQDKTPWTIGDFTTFNLSASPNIAEQRSVGQRGQRTGIVANGFSVTGNASTGLIYGAYDAWLESLFQDSWTSDVLKNKAGIKTLSVESRIPPGAGASTYAHLRFRGVEATGGSLSMQARNNIVLNLDLLGTASSDASATAVASGSNEFSSSSETDIIGSGSDLSQIVMSGLGTLDCMRTMDVQFTYEGKEEQPRIGSDDLCGISRGAMVPTITGEFYIEDNFITVYNAARNGTEFALRTTLGSVSGKKYTLEFPKCKFSEAPLVTAESGPAFQNFTILPYYDSSEDATVKLTRAVA